MEAGGHSDKEQVLVRAIGMPRSLKIGGGHAVKLRRAGWVLEHEAVGLRVVAAHHNIVPCSGMHNHALPLLLRLLVQPAQTIPRKTASFASSILFLKHTQYTFSLLDARTG